METKLTPTEEKTCYVMNFAGFYGMLDAPYYEGKSLLNDYHYKDAKYNAEIMADGFNTFQKCHLLPSQLLQQRDELIQGCEEAIKQIEYLHGKFKETGTGNAVIAYLESLIQKHQI